MPTNLGPAEITLTLNISEIKRQIAEIERGVKGTPGQPRIGGTQLTQPRTDKGVIPGRALKEENYLKNVTDAVIKNVRGGLSGNELARASNSVVSTVSPFLPQSVVPAVKNAAKAAAVYEIGAQTMKLLPEAFALGKQVFGASNSDSRIAAIEDALDHFRQTIVAFESKFTSIFDALGQTTELNKAALRVQGKLIDSKNVYARFAETSNQENQLKKKFESFQSKEAPAPMTQTLFDIFKRSF